jgi:predicted O-methyltransferase YrrM
MDLAREHWARVDDYLSGTLGIEDATLLNALRARDAADLPPISVAPNQGMMLHLLVRATRARRVLEVGTLGAYSTIWLARGLPDGGKLISLEVDPKHASVARANLQEAGLGDRVEIRVGSALVTLPELIAQNVEPFDFVFIDADKEAYAEYFDFALRLTRRGGMIVADNVVRQGRIVDPSDEDERVRGIQRFYAGVAAAGSRVSATAVQTVGTKGHDGFAIILVN